jgi:hypothetical protein
MLLRYSYWIIGVKWNLFMFFRKFKSHYFQLQRCMTSLEFNFSMYSIYKIILHVNRLEVTLAAWNSIIVVILKYFLDFSCFHVLSLIHLALVLLSESTECHANDRWSVLFALHLNNSVYYQSVDASKNIMPFSNWLHALNIIACVIA